MGFVVADTTNEYAPEPLTGVFILEIDAENKAKDLRRERPGRIIDVVPTGKSKRSVQITQTKRGS